MPTNMLSTTNCKSQVATYYNERMTFVHDTLAEMVADWSSSLNSSIASLANGSASSILLSKWTGVRRRLSAVSSCIVEYKQMLGNLVTWLNSTAQSLSAAVATNTDIIPSNALINAFVKSGNVLQANLTRFLAGTMSKVELANAFSSWNNDLLTSANSLVSNIESSVISKLYAVVDNQQSMLTEVYQNLMLKLAALQLYLSSNDNSTEQLARSLSIWQTPIIGLQSDQVGSVPVL
jgi:hypothetical protein